LSLLLLLYNYYGKIDITKTPNSYNKVNMKIPHILY
jgi:hypothetical protein